MVVGSRVVGWSNFSSGLGWPAGAAAALACPGHCGPVNFLESHVVVANNDSHCAGRIRLDAAFPNGDAARKLRVVRGSHLQASHL